jgi:heat shock protein HtpX
MRILLFLGTNIAVLVLASITFRVLGLEQFMYQQGVGINLTGMLIFAAVFGMGGSFFSLLISKWMAKRSTGAQVIDQPRNQSERWLVDTVKDLAQKAGIGMPEVAVFASPQPNAFATGASKNNALVAVSSGLLDNMRPEEVRAVLGHEIGHVANGDMVTLTLIQGVVNTFVIFLARVVGYVVDKAVFRSERIGMGFYVTVFVCEIIFGILASMIVAWFSRQREFRADAASANLLGSPRPMVNALARLGGLQPGALPASFQSSGINNAPGWMALFSSHPPIEQRIEALQSRQSRAPGAV